MRTATTTSDADQIANCIANLVRFVQQQDAGCIDPYAMGLSTEAHEYAAKYINSDDAFALVEERDERVVACLAARITETSFPPSSIGLVGMIDVCWVDQDHRQKGIGKRMLREAENRFRVSGVKHIELSYLASNGIAEKAWHGLGFKPFRIFAFKEIPSEP